MHLLVRHKVFDFPEWKSVYDAHLSARQKAGLKEIYLFRNADDPNEVTLLFSVEDVHKAKEFAVEKAGVMGEAYLSFLNTAGNVIETHKHVGEFKEP